jgi:transposase
MWRAEQRPAADRRGLRYPSDLSDAEWALVEPLIPPARRGGRVREVNLREILNAIFYVLSTGCQWQALPKDLPPKSTAHFYFGLWDWDGTLERLHYALYVAVREREGARGEPDRCDHRQPERQGGSKRGSALDPQGYDAGKKITGRKRHILVDTLGLLLSIVVHPADVQDRDGIREVLRQARRSLPFIERIFADAGYQGPKAAQAVAQTGRWAHRDRQTHRSSQVRRPPQALGRRTNLRLDQPLPAPDARLRTLRENRRSLLPSRHDPPHAQALDPRNPLRMTQVFLDRL